MRGRIYQSDYTPQFAGHETFPLRYGWLKKVFDRVAETEHEAGNRQLCWDDEAIARFGVGKNMVSSMRHWAKVIGIINEPSGTNDVQTTELGRRLLSGDGSEVNDGLDPYMEFPASLWLVHWQLAGHPEKTTWFWAFSHFPAVTFDRDLFLRRLEALSSDQQWGRTSASTIRNDVACFIRTYIAKQPTGKTGHDDALESPLTELGLIKSIGKKDGFRFVRGPKSTLGDGVFIYALLDFWSRHSPRSQTLSFENIAHAPGSPGRVFAFDENDVADRLAAIEDVTAGKLRWSETAGLKQVIRSCELDEKTRLDYLPLDFAWRDEEAAA